MDHQLETDGDLTTLSIKTGNRKAGIHVFKSVVGLGIFFTPHYLTTVGYLVGPLCLILLAFVSVDCVMMLVQVKRYVAHLILWLSPQQQPQQNSSSSDAYVGATSKRDGGEEEIEKEEEDEVPPGSQQLPTQGPMIDEVKLEYLDKQDRMIILNLIKCSRVDDDQEIFSTQPVPSGLSETASQCSTGTTRFANRYNITYESLSSGLFSVNLYRWVIFSLLFSQFGFCIEYVQYSSGLLTELFPMISFKVFVVICVLIATPLTLLTNKLHIMAYSSFISISYLGFAVAVTTIAALLRLSSSSGRGDTTTTTNIINDSGNSSSSATATTTASMWADVQPLGSAGDICVFIVSSMTTYQCVGVILPLERSLSKPSSYSSVLKIVIVGIIATVYTLYALICYFGFGGTLMRKYPTAVSAMDTTTSFAAICARLALAVEVILTYPVQFTPAIQIVDAWASSTFGSSSSASSKTEIEGPGKKKDSAQALAETQREKKNEFYRFIAARCFMGGSFIFLSFTFGADTVTLIHSIIGAVASIPLCIVIPAMLFLMLPPGVASEETHFFRTVVALNEPSTSGESSSSTDAAARLFAGSSGLFPRSLKGFTDSEVWPMRRKRAFLYIVLGGIATIVSIAQMVCTTFKIGFSCS